WVVPNGCSQVGPSPLGISLLTVWSHGQNSGPTKANATISRKTTRLPTASRWRKNRPSTNRSWLRSLVRISSESYRPPGAATAVSSSLITDPRVQHGVEEIGDEVAEDHHGAEHQDDRHDRERLAVSHRLQEEEAHAPPAENGLGDHRAADRRGHQGRGNRR